MPRPFLLAVIVFISGGTLIGVAGVRSIAWCPATCKTDLDCSLNGDCSADGSCACEPAWTGPCCGSLNLLPALVNASGYRHPNTSTWGANIIREDHPGTNTTTWHQWMAEMAPAGIDGDPGSGSCGLTTWGSNSQITHISSNTSLSGPYTRQEVALPLWSHNPIVRLQPDGTYVPHWHGVLGKATRRWLLCLQWHEPLRRAEFRPMLA